MKKILKWLKPRLGDSNFEFETDRRFVVAVLGVTLLATLLLFIAGISRELLSFLIFALAAAVILAFRGNLKVAGIIGPLGGLVICTLLVFNNYGIRDTAVFGLPMVIVAASLINGQKGAIISGITSLVMVITLGVTESQGLVQNIYSTHNYLSDYLVVCVVIVLTVALQWAVIERLKENFRIKQLEFNERQRIEQEKIAYAHEMEALYQLSLELSELPAEKPLDEFFAQKLKELTQAFFVSLSEYNPVGKWMETRQVVVDNQFLNQAVHILGSDPRKIKYHVNAETYQEIVRDVVGYRHSLSEVSFGAIPPAIGATLQSIFHIDQFIGMAIIHKGELEATMVIALQSGKTIPSHRFFQALANLAAVAFWRKKSEQARLESETRFQQMAEMLPQGIFECDHDGYITYANHQAGVMIGSKGYTPGDHFLDLFLDENKASMSETFLAILSGVPAERAEYRVVRMDGSQFPALIYTSLIIRDGKHWGMRGVFVDITELKEAEDNLQRTNRFLRATSRCNLALVHAPDRQNLFNEICATMVEEIGYSFAWIGLIDDQGGSVVTPAAYFGVNGIQLAKVCANCCVSSIECHAMLDAIRRKDAVVVPNLETDSHCQVCKNEAISQNLQSMISLPLIYEGKVLGGMTVYANRSDHFSADEIKVLQEMSSDVAFGIHTWQVRTDRDQAIVRLEDVNQQLIEAYDITLQGWSQALELRERETAGHSQRVVRLTLALAEKLGVSPEQLAYIRWGAYLHDIGKIGIPDSILLKPAPLTEDEWKVMRQHPVYAHRLISSISFLKGAADIPHLHHERWNGSGYPFQMKGEEIPIAARIFAVVDVWDALIYDRPYRPAWSVKDTKEFLCQNAGKLFDPTIVPVFLELIESEWGDEF